MKRRTFLSTSSAVGLFSAVSGASVVSSVYSSISTNILLEEFDTTSRNVLNKFTDNVILNAKSLGLDEKIVKRIVTPTQIVNNQSIAGNQSITFKNKSGESISISIVKGVKRIKIFQA